MQIRLISKSILSHSRSYVILGILLSLVSQSGFSKKQETLNPTSSIANPLLICESHYGDLNAEFAINKENMILNLRTLENKNYYCVTQVNWINKKNAKIPFYRAESEYIEKCQPPLPKSLDRVIRNKVTYELNRLDEKSNLTWVRYEQPLLCKIKLNELNRLKF
jgi:hypothetical protein